MGRGGALKRRAIGRAEKHLVQLVDLKQLDGQIEMPEVNRIKSAAVKADRFFHLHYSAYTMNSISRYLGRGHSALSTMVSRWSTAARAASIFGPKISE